MHMIIDRVINITWNETNVSFSQILTPRSCGAKRQSNIKW